MKALGFLMGHSFNFCSPVCMFQKIIYLVYYAHAVMLQARQALPDTATATHAFAQYSLSLSLSALLDGGTALVWPLLALARAG